MEFALDGRYSADIELTISRTVEFHIRKKVGHLRKYFKTKK